MTAALLAILGGAATAAAIFRNGKCASPGPAQDCPALSTKSEAGRDSEHTRQG